MNDSSHMTTRAARAGAHSPPGEGLPLVPVLHQTTVNSYPDLATRHRVLDGHADGQVC
jgi:hypothetical protein